MPRKTIYMASRCKYGPLWRELRSRGYLIISTWIDESEPGESVDLSDLWSRCIQEASSADMLILYAEDGDPLKGALIELGAALVSGVPCYLVGSVFDGHSYVHHPLVRRVSTLEDALSLSLSGS